LVIFLIIFIIVMGCSNAPESELERSQRAQREAKTSLDSLKDLCYEINAKVYDCDSCPLTASDKDLAIRCKLEEMADEKGLTVEELRERYRQNRQPSLNSSQDSTETIDGQTIHNSSPKSAADWDELIRQAKKRDAEAKRRQN
jgi:hypothetical protein